MADVYFGLRVVFVDVKAQRQHQYVRSEGAQRGCRLVHAGKEIRFAGAMGHVGRFRLKPAPAPAPVSSIEAGDHRVEVGRVAMNRHVQHIVSLVEDFLDALAVVHVGVEHCDFAEFATQHLGGDCAVVQEAEPTCRFSAGMVPCGRHRA